MVLFDILYIGQTGVRASQLGVRTASENVSNVNTPGYSRRQLLLSPSAISTRGSYQIGNGVDIVGTQRILDNALNARARDASTSAAGSSARSNILSQANVIFGDLEGGGASAALDEFFAALDLFAASPQDLTSRTNVIASAGRLTEAFNTYGRELLALQNGMGNEITARVDEVNRLGGIIADLNNRIGSEVNPSNDLLDRRDQAINELAEIVKIQVIESENGLKSIALEGGYGLVVGQNLNPLQAVATGTLVQVQGEEAGVARDLTSRLRGGTLGGLLRARDDDLGATLEALDQFVFDFVTELNTLHRTGFGLDGVGGRDLFVQPTAVDGAAQNMTLDPTVAGDPRLLAGAADATLIPGDNTNALALAEFRFTALAGGEEPADALRGLLQEFGDRAFSAAASAENDRFKAESYLNLRESISGVSIDEELTTLLQFQQSFQAAASIIRTADELTQEIIALKR
jgi:flagellar hook-associated protein 1 FlgK